MNLKSAARKLDVHYQTAYRWVRTGQLVAVKVGAGYEISDAALERFEAQRAALGRAPDIVGRATAETPLTTEAALELLDEMVDATLIDATPVETRATQLVAAICGDAAAVHCCNANGTLRIQTFDHREPEHAALMSAMLKREQRGDPAYARQAVHGRAPVLIPQVPQREIRALLPAEFHQFLSVCGFYSAMSAPIFTGERVRGALSAARDTPGRPYTGEDLDFLVAVAARIGSAMERADRARQAWDLRAALVPDLSAVFADTGHAPTTQWLDDRVDVDQAVAIVDLEQRVRVATKEWGELLGLPREDMLGRPLADLVTPETDVTSTFRRLDAGELDYCTVAARPVFESDRALVLDGGIVRHADATPCCVMYVAHARPELARV